MFLIITKLNNQVKDGWRPGAISNRLFRKLNNAKKHKSAIAIYNKPSRRLKKRVESKPTLIISKINGEYRIEMQVTSEDVEGNKDNNQQCNPLIYKIAKANNEDRIKKSERKKRRLIKEAIGDWSDPYHPEVCERTCFKAYKQAIGLEPYDPNNPECICDGEEEKVVTIDSCFCDENYSELSSDCSSLDINWEIHFTPPYKGNRS